MSKKINNMSENVSNTKIPDINEAIKLQLAAFCGYDDIRFPGSLEPEIEGVNSLYQYRHIAEDHTHNIEIPLEDLVFINSRHLPYLKAQRTLAKNLLIKIDTSDSLRLPTIPYETIERSDKLRAEKWLNIQTLLIEMIQFLEGYNSNKKLVTTKELMMQKIYNKNLGTLDYLPQDWASLLERERFEPNNNEAYLKTLTPNNYKKYILKEGMGYTELEVNQYPSFVVLEMYRKQKPLVFENFIIVVEEVINIRKEVRNRLKPSEE